jgi:phenylacetate-CoA ligase
MSANETLYRVAPYSLQTALVSLYGLKLLVLRRGPVYWNAKRFWHESAGWSRAQLEEYQAGRLTRFVEAARLNSPFYRERLAGLTVRSVADLRRLPVIDKETFRTNLPSIRTIPRGTVVHTGGTTGKPLEVLFAKHDLEERFGVLDAWRETHGVANGRRRATFSGRIIVPPGRPPTRFAVTNLALRQRLYSCFHLHEANLEAYVADLERFQPEFIDGFPSAIATLAGHLAATGRRLSPSPKVVFTTSENLYDHQRVLIQQAFGCPVRNQYASAEGAPFVVECPLGRLHYDLRTGVIEAGEGSILVTSFTTSGTPLIRYRIGDQMEFADGVCDCGNQNPLVSRIVGREQDYLVSPERGMVAVGLIDIFKALPPVVKQAQVAQEQPNAVVLRLVIDQAGFAPEHEEVLRGGLRERLGPSMAITIERVDRIDPEPGGKILYIKRAPGIVWNAAAGAALKQPQ